MNTLTKLALGMLGQLHGQHASGEVIPGGHPNSPTDGHLKLPHLS